MRTTFPYKLIASGMAFLLALTACTNEEVGSSQEDTEDQTSGSEPFEPVQAPEILAEMNLDEKIGQLLVLTAQGTSAEENAQMIESYSPGGIIYFDANLNEVEQIAQMSAGVQETAAGTGQGVPLFIGIDQEQGLVSRLPVGTRFPDAMAVGASRDTDLAALRASTTADELAALGINLN